MKVLILFQDINHYHTIDGLCKNLHERKINVSTFNITSWRYTNTYKRRISCWIRVLILFSNIPKVRGLLTRLFRYKVLLKLADDSDIIDIHFFSPVYDELIYELKKKKKKIKITIWGSDFYRVDNARHEQQRKIFHLIDVIQVETEQIAIDFLEVFPEFKAKIRLAHFGIKQFDIIDELLSERDKNYYKIELGIPTDRIVLTCGTNRSEGHQHLQIIKNIEKLSLGIKGQIFLLFPMTYGGSKSYLRKVKNELRQLGIPFLVFSNFLSLEYLCKIRIVSDILLTVQKTDALSSAIQEHMYGGDLMIAGEWLPYKALEERGVFYLTSSLDRLSNLLTQTIIDFDSISPKCIKNKAILSEFSSWSTLIEDWINIYNELENI